MCAGILHQSNKNVTAHLQVDCMESTSDALNTISSCEVTFGQFHVPSANVGHLQAQM